MKNRDDLNIIYLTMREHTRPRTTNYTINLKRFIFILFFIQNRDTLLIIVFELLSSRA